MCDACTYSFSILFSCIFELIELIHESNQEFIFFFHKNLQPENNNRQAEYKNENYCPNPQRAFNCNETRDVSIT